MKRKRIGVLDAETTIFQKGNPFSERNKLCQVGLLTDSYTKLWEIEYGLEPYDHKLKELQAALDELDLVIGFNLKFDLNWLARYGVRLKSHTRVYDCQLSFFIRRNQQPAYPSLNDALAFYGLEPKLDIVKRDYWDLEIDTPSIPLDVLSTYLTQDLTQTYALYQALEAERISQRQEALINLANQDLIVLHEMETNGIPVDWKRLAATAEATRVRLQSIIDRIHVWVPEHARVWFNPDSTPHVSALLYGGTIVRRIGTPTERVYKSGPNKGETYIRNQWEDVSTTFERLTKPLDGTELADGKSFSTDEGTLRTLKKPKDLIKALLEYAEVSKLLQTYYDGLPAIAEKYDWRDGLLHGTFNQCRVITGRLASEKPNLQNMPELMNEFFVSRFT